MPKRLILRTIPKISIDSGFLNSHSTPLCRHMLLNMRTQFQIKIMNAPLPAYNAFYIISHVKGSYINEYDHKWQCILGIAHHQHDQQFRKHEDLFLCNAL